MESVIKQAEDARNKAVEVARHLYNEYRPMKAEVDRTRRECLGLDVLPDLQEEEGSHIPPGYRCSLTISSYSPIFNLFIYLLVDSLRSQRWSGSRIAMIKTGRLPRLLRVYPWAREWDWVLLVEAALISSSRVVVPTVSCLLRLHLNHSLSCQAAAVALGAATGPILPAEEVVVWPWAKEAHPARDLHRLSVSSRRQ